MSVNKSLVLIVLSVTITAIPLFGQKAKSKKFVTYKRFQKECVDKFYPEGTAVQAATREVNTFKNRTAIAKLSDFDSEITLSSMMEEGNDENRFEQGTAATIVGFVADVKKGGIETCNCKAQEAEFRDTHIELVLDPKDVTSSRKVIVEVKPTVRHKLKQKDIDWSTSTLKKELVNRWIKVSGWLFYDSEHHLEANNIDPKNKLERANWRQTCWEIHPIQAIEILELDYSSPESISLVPDKTLNLKSVGAVSE